MDLVNVDIHAAADRLASLYRDATPATREAGRTWYMLAQAECEHLAETTGVPIHVAAGIMAAHSVRTRWSKNLEYARTAATGGYVAGMQATRSKVVAIRDHGADPADVLGRKTATFYRAIMGDDDAVTLDTHALAAAGWPGVPDRTPGKRAWQAITGAYVIAAENCGETPRDFQAIVWCHWRGAAN